MLLVVVVDSPMLPALIAAPHVPSPPASRQKVLPYLNPFGSTSVVPYDSEAQHLSELDRKHVRVLRHSKMRR